MMCENAGDEQDTTPKREEDEMKDDRRAGVLAHVTSIPSRYGIGDLGSAARDFAALLKEMGMRAWQVLPLGPTDGAAAWSPYCSPSAFAGDEALVSPDDLELEGLVSSADLLECAAPSSDAVDLAAAHAKKSRLLDRAHANFRRDDAYRTKFRELSDEFWDFCAESAWWLEDYALYVVLKAREGGAGWTEWRPAYRDRDWGVLDALKAEPEVSWALDRVRFGQFIFDRQARALREACARLGIEIIGDMPIYTAHDSADVWGHRDLFDLEPDGSCASVAGVPPDAFSEDGQRWGSPLYKWDVIARSGWQWWIDRASRALRLVDVVRIDHFRGIVGYWSIPASAETAVDGEWLPGPGGDLIAAMRDKFADLPFIAEDLGVITQDVVDVMEEFALPGMRVLQFAFGEEMPTNPHAPHLHRRNSVVYCGTHDNDTTAGWWSAATTKERANFLRYVSRTSLTQGEAADEMIRLAMSSTARMVLITPQDILRLGTEARMNEPSTVAGNWAWRLRDLDALRARALEMRSLVTFYGR